MEINTPKKPVIEEKGNKLKIIPELSIRTKLIGGFLIITEKPHRGIGKLSPLKYYLDSFFIPPEKSNMLWTLTHI